MKVIFIKDVKKHMPPVLPGGIFARSTCRKQLPEVFTGSVCRKQYVCGCEGGSRCRECFRLRLRECARLAKEMGFDYFCTTLSVSRHKDAVLINALGEEAAAEFQISWLPSDFKKRDGENRSVELSEKHGIYRQLYCGCEFSLRCREAGKPGGQAE